MPKRSKIDVFYNSYFNFINMKRPILLIASTFLFSTTLVLYPIISTEKTVVQAQEASLNSAEAYYNRGFSYAEQGKYELAIADFNQAIKIGNQSDLISNCSRDKNLCIFLTLLLN